MTRRHKMMIVIGISTVLVIGAAVFTAFLPGAMEQRVRHLRTEGDWAAAMQVQSRLVRFFPRTDAARNAVMNSQANLAVGEPEVLVGPGFILTSGGVRPPEATVYGEQILDDLDRIAPRQRMEMWEYNLYEDKAQLLAELGRPHDAIETIRAAIDGFEDRGSHSRALHARITMLEWIPEPADRLQAAETLRNETETRAAGIVNYHERARLNVVIGDAARELGHYEEARDAYLAAIEAERRNIARANTRRADDMVAVLEEQPSYRAARFGLDHVEFLTSSQAAAAISGEITAHGEGLPNTRVYLSPDDGRHGVSTSRVIEGSFTAETASDGTFVMDRIPPGVYKLTVGLRGADAADLGRTEIPDTIDLEPNEHHEVEIRFHERISITEPTARTRVVAGPRIEVPVAWSPVAGAETYAVELLIMMRNEEDRITGWVGLPFLRDVREARYEIVVEGLELWSQAGLMYGSSGLRPAGVLGAWHPGALLGLRVIAYGRDGDMVSDSEGILYRQDANYPLLVLEEQHGLPGTYSDAIDATVQTRYEEAVRLWDEAIAELRGLDGLSTVRRDELLMGAHLALARLHARLDNELQDRAIALEHYEALLRMAETKGYELPRDIRTEVLGYGTRSGDGPT